MLYNSNIECVCSGDCPNCGDETRRNRQEVSVTLRRENLLYDIRNCAFIESHTLPDDAPHIRHLVADIAEEGNIDRVDRVIALTFSILIERLGKWTHADLDTDTKEISDDRWTPCEYRLRLCLPRHRNKTTVHLLGHLLHEYIVLSILYDWLLTAVPQSAEQWAIRLRQIDDELDRLLNTDSLVFRRHSSPW